MDIEEAINEMIAQTVCESENLTCEKDCPYYNKRKKRCTVLDKDFEPEKAVEGLKTVLNELEKKDKVINEMAEWINRIDSKIFCNKEKCNDNCKECVIEEFTKKVEGK